MKLYILKRLCEKLKQNSFIKVATRINDNTIKIIFDKEEEYYFNLNKANNFVYKKDTKDELSKIYNAPFDLMLYKKFSGSKIKKIEIVNNDRIIRFYCYKSFSYKSINSILQLEFTGKYTNAIILDENLIVQEALRHIDKKTSFRAVKIGNKLEDLKPFDIKEIQEDIKDLDKYFFSVYDKNFQSELDNRKKQSITKIDKNINKTQKILNELINKTKNLENTNKLYEKANIALSCMSKIDIYKTKNVIDGQEIIISGNYSSKEDFVNSLFSKAKKNKAKLKNSVLQKDNLEEKILFFTRQKAIILKAKNLDEYSIYVTSKKNKSKIKLDTFLYNGFRISVGKNSAENITLLKMSKKNDYWFHLQGIASAHVIIHIDKKKPKEDVLIQASKYCVEFSTSSSGRYLVDYTIRKNVKTINGSKVAYDNYKTLVIIKD
jgi:predicted ribosome quality control (RQC) complex YloA/Tae2 family protein